MSHSIIKRCKHLSILDTFKLAENVLLGEDDNTLLCAIWDTHRQSSLKRLEFTGWDSPLFLNSYDASISRLNVDAIQASSQKHAYEIFCKIMYPFSWVGFLLRRIRCTFTGLESVSIDCFTFLMPYFQYVRPLVVLSWLRFCLHSVPTAFRMHDGKSARCPFCTDVSCDVTHVLCCERFSQILQGTSLGHGFSDLRNFLNSTCLLGHPEQIILRSLCLDLHSLFRRQIVDDDAVHRSIVSLLSGACYQLYIRLFVFTKLRLAMTRSSSDCESSSSTEDSSSDCSSCSSESQNDNDFSDQSFPPTQRTCCDLDILSGVCLFHYNVNDSTLSVVPCLQLSELLLPSCVCCVACIQAADRSVLLKSKHGNSCVCFRTKMHTCVAFTSQNASICTPLSEHALFINSCVNSSISGRLASASLHPTDVAVHGQLGARVFVFNLSNKACGHGHVCFLDFSSALQDWLQADSYGELSSLLGSLNRTPPLLSLPTLSVCSRRFSLVACSVRSMDEKDSIMPSVCSVEREIRSALLSLM